MIAVALEVGSSSTDRGWNVKLSPLSPSSKPGYEHVDQRLPIGCDRRFQAHVLFLDLFHLHHARPTKDAVIGFVNHWQVIHCPNQFAAWNQIIGGLALFLDFDRLTADDRVYDVGVAAPVNWWGFSGDGERLSGKAYKPEQSSYVFCG